MGTKNRGWIIKLIGALQIVGGITGLGLICSLLLQTEAVNGAILLIFLIGLSLFIFSIYCGVVLLAHNKKKGIILSLINQMLQLFQWCLFGYGLSYSSGIELLIGIKSFSLDFNFDVIFSTFAMAIKSNSDFFLKINLIPILLIIILIRLYYKIGANDAPKIESVA